MRILETQVEQLGGAPVSDSGVWGSWAKLVMGSVGLLGALELVSDRKTKKPFERKDGLMAYATKQALSNGLIARATLDDAVLART